jgi:hypothetical protein
MTATSTSRSFAIAAVLALGALGSAHADSDRKMPRNTPPAYQQECASCHTAYPPGMLPARSWQRIMNTLDKHYGSDATLDAATCGRSTAGCRPTPAAANTRAKSRRRTASRVRPGSSASTARSMPAVWQLTSVKTPANCGACHPGADQRGLRRR